MQPLTGGILPNSKVTPGDIDKVVMTDWVCNKQVDDLPIYKRDIVIAFRHYGVDVNDKNYRLDRLVPINLGGTNNVKNLWPMKATDFYKKKAVEKDLFRCICNGFISLKEAQKVLITNWESWNIDSLK